MASFHSMAKCFLFLTLLLLLLNIPLQISGSTVTLVDTLQQVHDLKANEAVEISVRINEPSKLPVNGRVAVEWQCPEGVPSAANWRKILHALDGDIYMTYRAPVSGKYTLRITPVVDEEPIGNASIRWREKGNTPKLFPLPKITAWPEGTKALMTIQVTPLVVNSKDEDDHRTVFEYEPNDLPELAQTIELSPASGNAVRTWEILGGADDLEFFDNGKVGQS
ncbi:MAG: hypothetical protein EBQ87_01035, partial [Planctomycetes bacterium]|nr:hypothetical protein [Planctomycetota bacterium]